MIVYVYFTLLQIIAEAANGPVTIAADRELLKRNILVIPVSKNQISGKTVNARSISHL